MKWRLLALAAAVGIGVAVGDLWRTASAGNTTFVLLAIVVVGSALLAGVAVTRFFGFVLVLLATRSFVDGILPGTSVGGLSVSEAVGVVFLVASTAWLVSSRSAGTLHPLSAISRAACGFATAALISAPFSLHRSEAFFASLKVLAIVLMLVVVEQLCIDRPERIRPLLWVTGLSVVVPTLTGLGQVFGTRYVDPNITVGRVNASFVHPNALATYAGIVAVVALATRRSLPTRFERRVAVVVAALAFGLLFFSYARAAWLGCAVAVLFIGAVAERRLLAGMVAALVAAVAFVPTFVDRLRDLSGQEVVRHVPANSLEWRVGLLA